jgi:hypothetical protein
MISKGFGFVAFFASVKASSVCIHPMVLGLTQALTEMSTRNISWWVKAAGA